MVEPIPNLPDNVLGYTAKGRVTARDYTEVIMPAVEALFARHGTVRFLYHLGTEFSGFEAGAMWDDLKLGVQHLGDWERMALVSDVEWVRAAVRFFSLVTSDRIRLFHNRELAEAMRWIRD